LDIAKRQRVMRRSQALGHCICDPRRSCPCDVFTNQGICPCAGERPEPPVASDVKLTSLVHNAGCASKISPADLEAVLSRLPAVDDPRVLSGLPAGDDAGVYKLTESVCLVQTVDVMTPCVDDPYTFGRICAANCLSDIYAMGGVPRTALSILAFPSETLDGAIMYEMMRGAMETLAEARVALDGGHSIKDQEIKLGFAITGTIEASSVVARDTAQVGDVLVLTKPLGTGVLSFCRQIGRADAAALAEAERTMLTTNRAAAEAMREAGVSACTDITGFGLLGHLIATCRHGGLTAEIFSTALPALPGAMEALRDGVVPGAIERNAEYLGDDLAVGDGVEQAAVHLGLDAQTSGGLLLAVGPQRHGKLLAALEARGIRPATIGRIVGKSAGRIILTTMNNPGPAVTKAGARKNEREQMSQPKDTAHSGGEGCCSDVFGGGSATSAMALQAFGSLMKVTSASGALDEKTKELISFALSVMSRCGPCTTAHLKKARKMGLKHEQIDEAAWCAIAMGGAPVKMFYEQALRDEKEGGATGCRS